MSNEKDTFGNHEKYDKASLERLRESHQDALREKLEKSAERRNENKEQDARHEALQQAATIEKESPKAEKKVDSAHERRPATKRERTASYNRTMDEVRSQLSGPSRVFSNFIHNPTVEKVSDAIGGTVVRPNAVLSGAVFAFLFTIVIYLTAVKYGYPLSGTEAIASFILGWIVGLIYDYLRLLMFGKNR